VSARREVKRRRAIKKAKYRGVSRTKNRTFLFQGLEFNEWPAPKFLLKAMKKEWAEEFLLTGRVCLNSMSFYHSHTSREIGDVFEGKGELVVNGSMVNVGSLNQHYMWCCSLPSTSRRVMYSLSNEYDVIIRVNDIPELMRRMSNALVKAGMSITPPHLGKVKYSRGQTTSNANNGGQWLWNCFQKRSHYQHQRECRIVFTSLDSMSHSLEPQIVDIGPCSDIATIEYKSGY